MYRGILLLLSIALISCGHIYVSDIQLDFQNSGYVSSAQLYFKLENDLVAQEVLKITWPYVFNSSTCSITCFITLPGSTSNLTSTTAIVDSTNSNSFVIEMDSKLSGQQWYRLNISTITPTQTVLQSPPAGYYEEQVSMESYSGHSSGKTTEFMLYDYNSACGFIAISPAPVLINEVIVGVSQNSTSIPSTSSENTYFETSYTIYITVKTKQDYEFGATYHFQMTGPFTWTGTCETITQDCTDADADCVSIYALVYNKDYICTYKDSLLSFVRYQNSSNLAISKEEYLKFKVKVKNPNKVIKGGLDIRVVSNYAKYIYEYKKITELFKTDVTALFCGSAKYLWGLSKSSRTPCPVRTYLSTQTALWNKIQFNFYPNLTFPSSTDGYRLALDVQAVNYINDMSIWTDCGAITGKSIKCATDTTTKLINCNYVGQLEVNVTKYIKFAYVAFCDHHDATKFQTFGEVTFYHMDDGSAITSTATPIDQTMDTKICSANYKTGNQMFDATIAIPYDQNAYKAIHDSVALSNPLHRSSIHYSESKMDILLQITTNFHQQCCQDVTSLFYDCYTTLSGVSYVNSACNDTLGANTKAYHQVLKVVANNNIMSFDATTELDSANDDTIFKGVEVINDMFGMKTATTTTGNSGICMFEYDGGTKYVAICSSYSNPISYADATSTTDAATQYRFNQWHLRDTYLELHLSCYTALENTKICAAFENVGTPNTKGILIKNAQLNITANPLFPSQSELDFLFCLRYTATAGSLVLSGTTVLASSSLINAQIIHVRQQIGNTGNTTYFRIGYLNFYKQGPTTDVYTYVPTLLRIGGFIHEDDLSANKGIAFFFDKGMEISETKLSATMPLDPTECASPLVSTPICKYYAQKTITSAAITDFHEDYYPSLNVQNFLYNYYFKEHYYWRKLSKCRRRIQLLCPCKNHRNTQIWFSCSNV